jgi:hypothetical protein
MLPKFKKLWLEALRSDEYTQTKGNLRDAGGHCCLGVACEVLMKHPDILPQFDMYWEAPTYLDLKVYKFKMAPSNKAKKDSVFDYDYSEQVLPTTLRVALGIHDTDVQGKLASMNDGTSGHRRHTFAEIADYIEEKL